MNMVQNLSNNSKKAKSDESYVHLQDTTTAKPSTFSLVQSLPAEIKNITAGGIAGMVAKTFVAPIDRIKLLYQVTNIQFSLFQIPKVVHAIIREEGFAALFKGNSVTLLRVFPYAGIQFMAFDKCKSTILKQHRGEKKKDGLTPLESLFAGSLAGAISVTLTYPLDLARAQLAVLMKMRSIENPWLGSILKKNYQRSGVSGLFRGVTPSLLGIVPYSGVAFAINEQAKRRIKNVLDREPTTIEKMQCGALAGLFAQTLTYPLEITRRRMQTIGIVSGKIADVVLKERPANVAAARSIPDYFASKPVSMVGTMKNLYKEQGFMGFFKGVSMNWIKGPISFSISFTIYDIVKELMQTPKDISRRNSIPYVEKTPRIN